MIQNKAVSVPRSQSPIELIDTIEPGCILLAHPRDDDSTWGQSVILILQHNTKSTIGVILNKKEWNGILHVDQSETVLFNNEVPEETESPSVQVKEINLKLSLDDNNLNFRSFGGPVKGDIILHTDKDIPKSKACKSHPGLYYIPPKTKLKRKTIIPFNKISPKQYCVYKGHAKWEPGQLESEIEQGFWWIARCPTSYLFSPQGKEVDGNELDMSVPVDMWAKILRELGGEYYHFSHVPPPPQIVNARRVLVNAQE